MKIHLSEDFRSIIAYLICIIAYITEFLMCLITCITEFRICIIACIPEFRICIIACLPNFRMYYSVYNRHFKQIQTQNKYFTLFEMLGILDFQEKRKPDEFSQENAF